MARMSKMDYQLHMRMQSIFTPNTSRHEAKDEYREMMGTRATHNRTVGIHSYKTYSAYKQTSIEFSRYIKSEHKDIKEVRQIGKTHIIEYLKHRQDDGKSAYTISKDMAALNKLFNTHITKKEAGIKARSYKDISRSRNERSHDRKYNPENYKDQITFAKSCGCRRQSVLVVTPERFKWEDGIPTQVFLKEKGGKERYVHILTEYQPAIRKILAMAEPNKPLFDSYTKKIDNHSFKREYAQKRYKEILGDRTDAKDYRGYDKRVLETLTKDLSHNRLDVTIYNYMR